MLFTPAFGDGLTNKQIGDILRYQARVGHVRRVRRGVYVIVPSTLSKSTKWRCRNWDRARTH